MSRWRAVARATCLTLLASGVGISSTAGRAAAEEVYPLASGGSLAISGHGWGHGRGLSQYGAQGAALRGVAAGQILSTYYPGTAAGTTDEGPIRVLIQDDDGVDLQVAAVTGLAVRDNTTGVRYPLPSLAPRWRLVNAGDGLHLQYGDGVGWSAYWAPAGSPAAFTGAAQFDGPDTERVFLPGGVSRDYRGAMVAVRGSGTSISSVNVLPLEWYLYGVVPRESPSSFAPAALQAQAVAARTYSAYKRAHAVAAPWDICNSTQCQVYGGRTLYAANGSVTALEAASTNAAVDATAAQVRLYNGAAAFTEFSATNGGWSTDGGVPYLAANPDPWDDNPANPLHNWTAALNGGAVQAAYPQVGTLTRLRITGRDGRGDWGGRVTSVVLEGLGAGGVATSVPVTGDQLRIKLGLRSTYWTVTASAIQAKYGALGGSSGFLGALVAGELSAAGGGAFSRYQGGVIYWSPPTGAQEVHGAILGKWGLLGTEAGFMGYPIGDEQGSSDGVGRFSRFQVGSIYWTPATGAQEVHGAISGKWAALGAQAGFLGYPVGDEQGSPDGAGRFSRFQGGSVFWTPWTGAQEVHGAIAGTWAALGAQTGFLGYPVADEQGSPDGVGRFSRFQVGSIYWTPATGAHEVHGAIAGKWAAFGAQTGFLGYPTSDETGSTDGVGRYSTFQNATIYWTPATGAQEVHGAIAGKWAALGAESSLLGYPVTDERGTPDGAARFSDFQLGSVYWTPVTGAHEVHGAIRATWAATGGQAGRLGVPVSDEHAVAGGARSDFEHGFVTWDAATGITTVSLR